MRTWRIKKPSKKSIKIYEKNKTDFTANLNKNIQDALDDMDEVEEIKHKKNKKPLTELQEEIWKLRKKGYNQKQIAKKLKKNPSIICDSEKYMLNKGHDWRKLPKTPKFA